MVTEDTKKIVKIEAETGKATPSTKKPIQF